MPIDRRQQILKEAKALFLHHGFPKVTLMDIAEAVGVSRPTLYQSFANKEEIYKALIAEWINQAITQIIESRDSTADLNQQLLDAIEIWVIQPYEMMIDTPKTAGIADCSYDFAKTTLDEGYVEFSKQMTSILNENYHQGRLPNQDLANFISLSLRGLKDQAADLVDLRKLINHLLILALASKS